jgi:hypothetical protein
VPNLEHRSENSPPQPEFELPANSLFTHCDPHSLSQHLEKYLPTQILGFRPPAPNSPFSHFFFKGFDILFPHEIEAFQQLLKELDTQQKTATRITEENEQTLMIKAPMCIVLLKTGQGRAWVGPLRELPEDKHQSKTKNGRLVSGLNFNKYIFFEITS